MAQDSVSHHFAISQLGAPLLVLLLAAGIMSIFNLNNSVIQSTEIIKYQSEQIKTLSVDVKDLSTRVQRLEARR